MVNFNNYVRAFKVQFLDYVENITKGFSVPDKKLVADLMWGTLSSGCILISDIARNLHEENSLSNIENRLTRRIRNFDFEKLYAGIAERAFTIFSSPYSLCIDESDIGKEYSKALEDLCTVRDGSKQGDILHNGYHLTGIATIGGRKNFVFVLRMHLWSQNSKDFISANTQTEESLKKVFYQIERLKMSDSTHSECSLDRGYDNSKTMNFLDKYDIFYSVRVKSNRKYMIDDKELSLAEINRKYKGKYAMEFISSNGGSKSAKFGAVEVSHNDFNHKLMLVFEKFSKTDIRYYLTNRIEMTKTGISKALKLYRKRWRIEEVFRFIKQEFKAEKYLVRNMNSMNTLMAILTASINFITEISMSDSSLLSACKLAYPQFEFKEKEEELLEIYGKNGLKLYQIKRGIQIILSHTKGRPEIKHRNRRQIEIQGTIFDEFD